MSPPVLASLLCHVAGGVLFAVAAFLAVNRRGPGARRSTTIAVGLLLGAGLAVAGRLLASGVF
jgi:hypothetical protein